MKYAKKHLQQQGRRRNGLFIKSWWLSILFVCLSLWAVGAAFAAEIQIVCHPDIPVDSLSRKEIRDVFLGKTIEWEHEEKVVISILKNKSVHKDFLKTFVGMSPSKFRTYWKQMIFTGKSSSSPKSFKTEEKLLEFVAGTEGAIGYVSSETQVDELKVLTISE